tara:strand:+ start:10587 stop:11810 length:1224 start_codon:yes stop_codon:yes gene_type:complete
MRVGFIGLGKLGLPCALAIEKAGHSVWGYDIDENVKNILETKELPYREEGAPELLKTHNINFGSVKEVVENSDIIFVPIQTPHDPKYEGTTRIPEERVDFDYTWLKAGISTLSNEVEAQGNEKIVIIISTVLPGTVRSEIKPILSPLVKLCYNPFFIAMGTTIKDFTQPEFVLFGVDDQGAYETARDFYATIHDRPVYKCTIEEAEMIKVSYNTYITMKICLANIIMEVAHKSENVNCDNVMDGLFLATERLISTKYMQGGMGDGGGCHPRDNIALSWLARKLDVSYDWYESLMICREKQTDWLADLMEEHDLPKVIMGRSFKPETNLILGSPAILLENILVERGHEVTSYDPKLGDELPAFAASCFLIGCKHEEFKNFSFPQGSVVIDPHRYIADQDGITVIRVGG